MKVVSQLKGAGKCDQKDMISIHIPCNEVRLKTALSPFLGQKMSEEVLLKIKACISEELSKSSGGLMVITIPEQEVSDGCLLIEAIPVRIESLKITGNRWNSSKWIQSILNISPGDLIHESNFLNAAGWINQRPFIHTDLILSKGQTKGGSKVEVVVKDRFPARFYAGTDNTGSSFSGNERLFAGTNIGLGLAGLITYQYTAAYDFSEFQSHFGALTFYLPSKHELGFYGGYAKMEPKITNFPSKGRDLQGSFRYLVLVEPLYTPLKKQVEFGADFKSTNSDLFFLGALPDGSIAKIAVNQKIADLFQLYLGCKFSNHWTNGNTFSLALQAFASPAKFLPHQTEADYNSLRPGAAIRYIYARGALGGTIGAPGRYQFVSLFRAQGSTAALLPSEQYGLGGYDTVRGYQERVFLADNAFIGNFEFLFPSISFSSKPKDKLLFLAFVDSAYGYNWASSPAFPKDAWLLGIGTGVRYQMAPYISGRAEYGFRIHNTPFANDQPGRFHFSVIIGY